MNRRELLLTSLGLAALPLNSAFGQNKPQKWALLIGIDSYGGSGVRPLVGAVADAEALGKTLVEAAAFPAEHVTVLTTQGERKPTREEIVDQLDALAGKVKKDDTVIVFFAGHGCQDDAVNKTYLLPMNARATSGRVLRDTALSTEQFAEYLRRLPASCLLLAFDMCRVEIGRSGESTITPDIQTRGLDFSTAKPGEADSELPQVVVTWWSCSPGEKAYEMTREKRGYFSYFLEQGLRGKAGNGQGITLNELVRYVGPKVTESVKSREGQKQTPRFDFKGLKSGDELARIALTGSRVTDAVVTLKPTTARLAFSGLPEGSVITVEGRRVTGEYREDIAEKTKTVSYSVSAPGYQPNLGTVEIKRGELVTVSITSALTPLARVVFPELPGGAVVKLDGKEVEAKGEYREELNSATKTRELTIVAPGYKPYVAEIELRRGQLIRPEIALKASLESIASSRNGLPKFATAASKARTAGCHELARYLEQMEPIPGGQFTMGSGKNSSENPIHEVVLGKYYLGKFPVTWAIWSEYESAGAAKLNRPTFVSMDSSHPVVIISWEECESYCLWASNICGVPLRLPTEAEWERAARGGRAEIEYPWGDEMDDSKCWADKTSNKSGTTSVYRQNNIYTNHPYGVIDMAGNVWEWCSDWYGMYRRELATNPTGSTTGEKKIVRGGSWISYEGFRCAHRSASPPNDRKHDIGFRLCSTDAP